jgi:hypothetical protein
MKDKGVQLDWCGQPIRPGSGFGYGGREENISHERPAVETVITETDLAALFETGPIPRAEAAKQLQAFTGASRATCYRALDLKGRFTERLIRDRNGMLAWRG